ncbi:MAG: hypothetical protein K0R75_564 [Paenibacillaceae bacterium]|nr:hypothetical protein [Paenibacillaceae bacterium]
MMEASKTQCNWRLVGLTTREHWGIAAGRLGVEHHTGNEREPIRLDAPE